eukprot:3307120-Rhodomonas_salina.5
MRLGPCGSPACVCWHRRFLSSLAFGVVLFLGLVSETGTLVSLFKDAELGPRQILNEAKTARLQLRVNPNRRSQFTGPGLFDHKPRSPSLQHGHEMQGFNQATHLRGGGDSEESSRIGQRGTTSGSSAVPQYVSPLREKPKRSNTAPDDIKVVHKSLENLNMNVVHTSLGGMKEGELPTDSAPLRLFDEDHIVGPSTAFGEPSTVGSGFSQQIRTDVMQMRMIAKQNAKVARSRSAGGQGAVESDDTIAASSNSAISNMPVLAVSDEVPSPCPAKSKHKVPDLLTQSALNAAQTALKGRLSVCDYGIFVSSSPFSCNTNTHRPTLILPSLSSLSSCSSLSSSTSSSASSQDSAPPPKKDIQPDRDSDSGLSQREEARKWAPPGDNCDPPPPPLTTPLPFNMQWPSTAIAIGLLSLVTLSLISCFYITSFLWNSAVDALPAVS